MPRSILLLTNRVPFPLHDGGALAMDAMIRGYAAAGWSVYVLAMNTSRHRVPKEQLISVYSDLSGFYTVDVDNDLRKAAILKNLLFSQDPEHVERFRNEQFAQQLKSLLDRIKPDVVQMESPFLGTYLPLIRQTNAVVVYRMHNVEGQIWSSLADASKGLKRAYLRNLASRIDRYEKRLWQSVDLLLPITGHDADLVRATGITTKMVVAPFAPLFQLRKNIIVWPERPNIKVYHIGAMDWLPNADGLRWFLDEVWPLLQEWAPQVTFHFAGRNMPASFTENLPAGVYCAGEVPDMESFIADKHILAVPIRSGGGIRVKILEAMAAGKLVVSTATGVQGIEARDGLHFTEANTAREFAQAIAWASTHPEKAEAYTHMAHKLVESRYNAGAIMREITDALESMTRK